MATKFPTLVKEEVLDQFSIKKGLEELQALNKKATQEDLSEKLREMKVLSEKPVFFEDSNFKWDPKTGNVSNTRHRGTIGKTLNPDTLDSIVERWFYNEYEPTLRDNHSRNRNLPPPVLPSDTIPKDKNTQQLYIQKGLNNLKEFFDKADFTGGGVPIVPETQPSPLRIEDQDNNIAYPVVGYPLQINNPFGGEQYKGPTIDPTEDFPTKNSGVDLFAPKGTSLVSPREGRVVHAGSSRETKTHHGYGNTVLIKADDGSLHRLSHLSEVQVKKGQKLSAGDVIGLSGDTGNTTGPHVDYEFYTPKGKLADATLQFNKAAEVSPVNDAGGAFDDDDIFSSDETLNIQQRGGLDDFSFDWDAETGEVGMPSFTADDYFSEYGDTPAEDDDDTLYEDLLEEEDTLYFSEIIEEPEVSDAVYDALLEELSAEEPGVGDITIAEIDLDPLSPNPTNRVNLGEAAGNAVTSPLVSPQGAPGRGMNPIHRWANLVVQKWAPAAWKIIRASYESSEVSKYGKEYEDRGTLFPEGKSWEEDYERRLTTTGREAMGETVAEILHPKRIFSKPAFFKTDEQIRQDIESDPLTQGVRYQLEEMGENFEGVKNRTSETVVALEDGDWGEAGDKAARVLGNVLLLASNLDPATFMGEIAAAKHIEGMKTRGELPEMYLEEYGDLVTRDKQRELSALFELVFSLPEMVLGAPALARGAAMAARQVPKVVKKIGAPIRGPQLANTMRVATENVVPALVGTVALTSRLLKNPRSKTLLETILDIPRNAPDFATKSQELVSGMREGWVNTSQSLRGSLPKAQGVVVEAVGSLIRRSDNPEGAEQSAHTATTRIASLSDGGEGKVLQKELIGEVSGAVRKLKDDNVPYPGDGSWDTLLQEYANGNKNIGDVINVLQKTGVSTIQNASISFAKLMPEGQDAQQWRIRISPDKTQVRRGLGGEERKVLDNIKRTVFVPGKKKPVEKEYRQIEVTIEGKKLIVEQPVGSEGTTWTVPWDSTSEYLSNLNTISKNSNVIHEHARELFVKFFKGAKKDYNDTPDILKEQMAKMTNGLKKLNNPGFFRVLRNIVNPRVTREGFPKPQGDIQLALSETLNLDEVTGIVEATIKQSRMSNLSDDKKREIAEDVLKIINGDESDANWFIKLIDNHNITPAQAQEIIRSQTIGNQTILQKFGDEAFAKDILRQHLEEWLTPGEILNKAKVENVDKIKKIFERFGISEDGLGLITSSMVNAAKNARKTIGPDGIPIKKPRIVDNKLILMIGKRNDGTHGLVNVDSTNEALYDLAQQYNNDILHSFALPPIYLSNGIAALPDRVIMFRTGGMMVVEVKPTTGIRSLLHGSPYGLENGQPVFRPEYNNKMSLAQRLIATEEYLRAKQLPYTVATEDTIIDLYRKLDRRKALPELSADGESIPVMIGDRLNFNYIEALLRRHLVTKGEMDNAAVATKLENWDLRKRMSNFNSSAIRSREAFDALKGEGKWLERMITMMRLQPEQLLLLQRHLEPGAGAAAGFTYGFQLPHELEEEGVFTPGFPGLASAIGFGIAGGITGKGISRASGHDIAVALAKRANKVVNTPQAKRVSSKIIDPKTTKAVETALEELDELIGAAKESRKNARGDFESALKGTPSTPSIPEPPPPVVDIKVGSLVTDTSTDTPRFGRVLEIKDDVYVVQLDSAKTTGGRGTTVELNINNLKYEGENTAANVLDAHLGILDNVPTPEPENNVIAAVSKMAVRKFRRNWIDDAASVEAFENAVAKEIGRSLTEGERVYILRRFLPAATSAESQRLHRIFEPVRELDGNEERMLNVLLVAQRNNDIGLALAGKKGVEGFTRMLSLDHIQKLLNKGSLFPGGRVPIDELLKQMETKIGRDGVEKIVAAAENIKKEWRILQDELIEEGLLSASEVAAFRAKFPNFIQVNLELGTKQVENLEDMLNKGTSKMGGVFELDNIEKLKKIIMGGTESPEYNEWLLKNPEGTLGQFQEHLLQKAANQVNQELPLLTHINTRLTLAELMKRNKIKRQLFKMSHLTDKDGKVVETGIHSYQWNPRTKKWHRLINNPDRPEEIIMSKFGYENIKEGSGTKKYTLYQQGPRGPEKIVTSTGGYDIAVGKGEPQRIALLVPKELDSVFNLPYSHAQDKIRMLGRLMGVPIFRWGTTAASSSFIPVNMIIDAWTFIERSGSWLKQNPKVAGGALGRAYIDMVLANQSAIIGGSVIFGGGIGGSVGENTNERLRNAAIGAALVGIFGTGARAWKGFPKVPKEWDEFVESGGGQSHLYIGPRTVEELTRGLSKRPYGKTPTEIWKNYRRDGLMEGVVRPIYDNNQFTRLVTDMFTLKHITEFGGAVENAPRLAAYRLALATGLDHDEAVLMGRDITLDFQKSGRYIKGANFIIPYLNASIQGAERIVSGDLSRLWKKDNEGKWEKGTALRAFGYGLAPVIISTIYTELAGRAQNLKAWMDIPDWMKDGGLNWMTPVDTGTHEDGTKRAPLVFHFPIRREYQFIKVLIIHALETSLGDDTDTWHRALTAFNKFAPTGMGTELSAVIPPIPQEILEQAVNYDFWKNGQIIPKAVSIDPAKYQTGRYVSKTAETLGPIIGKIPFLPEGFSSPIRIDHAIQGVLGSVGKQAVTITDYLLGGRKDPDIRDTPFVGPVSARFLRPAGGQRRRDEIRRINKATGDRKEIAFEAMRQTSEWKEGSTEIRRKLESGVMHRIEYNRIIEGRAGDVFGNELTNVIKGLIDKNFAIEGVNPPIFIINGFTHKLVGEQEQDYYDILEKDVNAKKYIEEKILPFMYTVNNRPRTPEQQANFIGDHLKILNSRAKVAMQENTPNFVFYMTGSKKGTIPARDSNARRERLDRIALRGR